jgi:hypothetical protein
MKLFNSQHNYHINLIKKSTLLPQIIPIKHRPLPVIKSGLIESLNELATSESIHIIAKSITTFTMIYCTLNYLHYKNLNNKK